MYGPPREAAGDDDDEDDEPKVEEWMKACTLLPTNPLHMQISKFGHEFLSLNERELKESTTPAPHNSLQQARMAVNYCTVSLERQAEEVSPLLAGSLADLPRTFLVPLQAFGPVIDMLQQKAYCCCILLHQYHAPFPLETFI